MIFQGGGSGPPVPPLDPNLACLINFLFNKVIIVYVKSDCMYRMKIACTVQVSFGLVLVLMPVEII